MKRRLENLPVSAMLRRSRPSTLRKCLFRIPVRVTVSTRRIHLAFGSAFQYGKGFPLDLGQPGTNVKARCNRVHDAGGGARRPSPRPDAQRFAVPPAKRRGKTHASPPSEAFSNSRRDIPCPVPHASREKHHFRLGYEKSGLAVPHPQYPSFPPLGTDPARPESEQENIIRTFGAPMGG